MKIEEVFVERISLLREYDAVSQIEGVGWLAVGDFNTIKNGSEKQGVRAPFLTQMQELQDVMDNCYFEKIEGVGASFTWTNKRQGSQC
ncbi:hypothetical protein FRX31_011336 [Thalictrum thalictroides]|uniref:Uncharacterized protein n=1 Tax=Thalictrum thalictroides TaxID=46969 RepID=A0A7J6WQ68_THATH|nr:hypothetical protein FRX31_011336 [Thalictrum thalictroides]